MPVNHLPGHLVLQHPKVFLINYTAPISVAILSRVPQSKSSCMVLLGVERLFVSSKASLDGSKAVRGGIPVVYPNFGAPSHPEHSKLAQHGFARTTVWKFDQTVMDNEAGVSVKLLLEPTAEIAAVYDKDFKLVYVVTLAEHQLSTDIHVTNTSTSGKLEFQSLLHTYLAAPAQEVKIAPLQSLTYFDKVDPASDGNPSQKVEARSSVDVRQPTDSVYEGAFIASSEVNVSWPGNAVEVRAKGFKDVVVWNPGEDGRKIGDMEEGGWNNYVCVEPGYVRGFVELPAGETWVGQQVITIKE
ncbi:glucose-6-phosphate 1-epimerase [Coprinopsis sp. MPI-PUGE-AT-0042]|nr:glucose-6-phosphate 1-epimerase [Coprinopsis sp. MPI-PUGE-AT-0042]